jgi:hypothetical protein
MNPNSIHQILRTTEVGKSTYPSPLTTLWVTMLIIMLVAAVVSPVTGPYNLDIVHLRRQCQTEKTPKYHPRYANQGVRKKELGQHRNSDSSASYRKEIGFCLYYAM